MLHCLLLCKKYLEIGGILNKKSKNNQEIKKNVIVWPVTTMPVTEFNC